jgi:hypothetical protein
MGGWVTGPILDISQIGTFLFIAALPMTFVSRRILGAVTVLASLLCLPLYLYFLRFQGLSAGCSEVSTRSTFRPTLFGKNGRL